MSRDGWVALPRGAMGLSAVCDCGISWSYSLTIFNIVEDCVKNWIFMIFHSKSIFHYNHQMSICPPNFQVDQVDQKHTLDLCIGRKAFHFCKITPWSVCYTDTYSITGSVHLKSRANLPVFSAFVFATEKNLTKAIAVTRSIHIQ